ncbi:predicted protein [Sclerotinia sclerotiorum 1980 UF-70]|uniref:Uncharacterized protein n=1 Tax=Sclerotinia sclerotiorum (strain ATCC 18683 / 1980 / Ss-1) TaxID=665079 RepID=A7EGY3_SCLS1|nr:predicted protein [Sclerotinia sclerotiorum 1980 UF-70]EDO02099.1 predicted protein [Sclerotinia sclerotiorum 1980 UF-70]
MIEKDLKKTSFCQEEAQSSMVQMCSALMLQVPSTVFVLLVSRILLSKLLSIIMHSCIPVMPRGNNITFLHGTVSTFRKRWGFASKGGTVKI